MAKKTPGRKAHETKLKKYGKKGLSAIARKAWKTRNKNQKGAGHKAHATKLKRYGQKGVSTIAKKAAQTRRSRASAGGSSNKKEEDIIFELWDGTPVSEISKTFNVSIAAINMIGRKQGMPGKRGRPSNLLNNFNVRALRRKLGLSRAEFARKVGVSTTTVFVWETKGKIPSAKYVIKMKKMVKKA